MPDAASLAVFVVASAVLGITPGPDILYVILRGAAQGRRAGLAAAAGLCTGIVGHTVLCAAGVSAVLAASATAFSLVKFAGAGYLIYLGLRMWRSGRSIDVSGGGGVQPLWAIYRQTVVMNLLNPKVALFFLAFLPQFADPRAGPIAPQLLLLGLLFMAVSFVVMAGAGMAGGQIGHWLRNRPERARAVTIAAGGVLIALGLRLAFQERG